MREREVKLSAGAGFALPCLEELGDGVVAVPRADERLSTVYFDSDDLRLARWGLSLRHRGGQGWTLKLPAPASGVLLVRDEIVFDAGPGSPPPGAVALLRGHLRHAELRPQVRLRTLRRGVLLRDGRGTPLAEVVDDAVSVVEGRRIVDRFRELEVETTEAIPAGLLEEVIAELRDAGAGSPDPTPKYLRALGGVDQAPPEVSLRPLRRSATLGDVVTRAISDGVLRLLRNDPVVRLDTDPEGVHQTRVATRRLRSDLQTLGSALDRRWAARLRDELGWLAAVLGEARDADVLLARLTARAAALPGADASAAASLLDSLAQRRTRAHAALLEAMASDRYLDLVDALVAAAQAPALVERRSDRAATAALPPLVERAWERLSDRVASLPSEPADADLHAVRILAKRCRYVAEACAPSLGGRTRRFAAAAAKLQDVLGELNDGAVAEIWLREWAGTERPAAAAFAAGELAAMERHAAAAARSRWWPAWKRVRAAAPES